MLLQQFNKENENINMPVEIPPSWICTLLFDNRPTDRRFYRICDKEVMVYIKEYNTVLPMPSNQQCILASFLNTCYILVWTRETIVQGVRTLHITYYVILCLIYALYNVDLPNWCSYIS